MLSLPLDILNEIQSYLPTTSQPQWRRVSKQTYKTYFDWQKQCCFEPTSKEISLCLYKIFTSHVLTSKYEFHINLNIRLYKNSEDVNLIIIDIQTRTLRKNFTYELINNLYELLEYTRDRKIILDKYITIDQLITQWQFIRYTLRERKICIQHDFNPDEYFIKLLGTKLPYIINADKDKIVLVFTVLSCLLKDEIYKKLVLLIKQDFNLSPKIIIQTMHSSFSPSFRCRIDENTESIIELWVQQKILDLKPEDLTSELEIWY